MTVVTSEQLPVVSLPQTELLTINVDSIPLVTGKLAPGVSFKPLFLEPEVGIWVLIATFEPGSGLPIHLHTGSVHAYTLTGAWGYREYPEQLQTAGSYLYEPGASVHTLFAPESNTEDTNVLYVINGANVNFSEDGKFHSILDAVTVMKLSKDFSEESGLAVDYLTAGGAQFSSRITEIETD
ncbi:2,4'-dihydroxyacetophenone dioxygenase family protein [Rhodococcus sp. IEGM 1379]|uniref:2,4'-dihydroxyacetophenone dioxygenase family protein n=1 Tax=Rhodococcus sp. IEGM 1379 TaxID=3047086 RepID=UPI0024B73217|nr:2,4'-dihydroxyacetophenone dioxygenase family protein [Rhodococcus sp. IEGM 1379]MDI9915571.1 2,4'-dihydroxyacetophenone dioxygenase family protein [Rhodococcus sp. IEGM 1379]